jgi:hypothetical protein
MGGNSLKEPAGRSEPCQPPHLIGGVMDYQEALKLACETLIDEIDMCPSTRFGNVDEFCTGGCEVKYSHQAATCWQQYFINKKPEAKETA